MANLYNKQQGESPASNPTHEQVKTARLDSGLTKKQAAEAVFCTLRAWDRWESNDRKMHPAIFDYFLIKTKQKNIEDLI